MLSVCYIELSLTSAYLYCISGVILKSVVFSLINFINFLTTFSGVYFSIDSKEAIGILLDLRQKAESFCAEYAI